ncbi:MAG: glycosyltransferase [Chloroflexi bacterium]|nr:glycosyltransferase [Chloroflexota bacterium]
MSGPDVSIVLPVYNQASFIAEVVERHEQALERLPWSHEMLLVVNGSRDDSYDVCHRLDERFEVVRTIQLEQGGWGRAVKAGLAEATGKHLCYSNSARTSAEDLLLLLLYALANPNAVVKAERKIRDSGLRRLGSLLYNLECRALFDLSYWDVNGTPKVFPREFEGLLQLRRDDDLIDLEFCVVCRRQQLPVIEVPILAATRHGGASTTRIGSAMRLYAGAWRMSHELRQQP